jgi:hypothetical protein
MTGSVHHRLSLAEAQTLAEATAHAETYFQTEASIDSSRLTRSGASVLLRKGWRPI